MLFNSPIFIFVFLPVFLILFFAFARWASPKAALVWAAVASLFFYAWDDPWRLAPLILASIAFNYAVGRWLARHRARWVLIVGVAGNLTLLAYLKYAEFAADAVAQLLGLPQGQVQVSLPIGISFYTFTQIAFLVDSYREPPPDYGPVKYGLFVTYFPHLIAGPILHHREIVPQFDRPAILRPNADSLLLGLSWFSAGLFKKVILADGIAAFVDPPFTAAASDMPLGFVAAWTGSVAYALQIYFDFSGYSDMAIGLALMIGITFPLNFDSPYKAASLIEFWRCWHMTLSRFLRNYLYIPLGGSRRGTVRRYLNLLITMLLGGLWHGAAWNFVLWGALHGAALALNHLWREAAGRFGIVLPRPAGQALTLLVVVLAWVPFRADTIDAAFAVWRAMFDLPTAASGFAQGTELAPALLSIGALSAVALLAPNTQQIFGHPSLRRPRALLTWTSGRAWGAALGTLFGIAVAAGFAQPSYFLYFRF